MDSKKPVVVIVCNALDDATRLSRRIYTDSPAASRKVFQMCMALRLAGVRPYVLSLGRGRADGSNDSFAACVRRVDGVVTIYAPFSHRRGWSIILSLFGLLMPLYRLADSAKCRAIFYNRFVGFLPALYWTSFLGYECFLDMEDGELASDGFLKKSVNTFVSDQFDRLCQGGALLACSALAKVTRVRPTQCYYGIAASSLDENRWDSSSVNCLMSGTLESNTGAPILVEAIRRLRTRQNDWATKLTFHVTGKGPSLHEFEQLGSESGFPLVMVHGRTTNSRYLEILRKCDVGLALKPIGGPMSDITFPSKVVEFAGSGLLVLSTDISDVRCLLGDGARYLENNDPEHLIDLLSVIAQDREAAKRCADLGRRAIATQCAPRFAGENLRNFLFPI